MILTCQKIVTNIRNDSFQMGDVVFSATPVLWITSLKDISTIDEGSVFFLFILFTVLLYHGRRNFHSPGICALMTIINIIQNIIGEEQKEWFEPLRMKYLLEDIAALWYRKWLRIGRKGESRWMYQGGFFHLTQVN